MASKTVTFLRAVIQDPPKDCVEWPFAIDRLGYGRARWEGRAMPAHRLAWQLYHGRMMPSDMDACHAPSVCHSRSCVNPLHIREGTRAENMADTHIDGTSLRGERSPHAKLREDQVRAIRADSRTYKEVAHAFGVSFDTVRSIKCGRRWGWLE